MVLEDDLSRFVGAGEWLAEYGSTRKVSWHCCWGKGVEGVSDSDGGG